MKFTTIRDVKTPSGNRQEDAGIDLYVPNDWNDGAPKELSLGESILIPMGVKVIIPHGYMGQILNKSGVSLKKGLSVGGGVVDASYRGEVMVQICKTTSGTEDRNGLTTIQTGEKIAQLVLTKISTEELEEISEEAYSNSCDTLRGEAGYGSTGIK